MTGIYSFVIVLAPLTGAGAILSVLLTSVVTKIVPGEDTGAALGKINYFCVITLMYLQIPSGSTSITLCLFYEATIWKLTFTGFPVFL